MSGGTPTIPRCAQHCDYLAESDHRTANHLALLASYIQLKGAELERTAHPTPADLRLFVQSVQGQVQSVARLHRLLSDQGPRAGAQLSQLLSDVCAPFAEIHADRVAMVQDFASDCLVRVDQGVPICQIVAEAVVNSVKHARTDGIPAVITVRCRSTEAGLCVEVGDNGCGIADLPRSDRGGLGFRLMRAHAEAAGGTLRFETGLGGFKVTLTVPQARPPLA